MRVLGTVLLATLLAAIPFARIARADEPLSLAEAVRQTLAANLELATERQALAAVREDIGLARSSLLPRADFGARAEHLDTRRTGPAGDRNIDSFLVGAQLTQSVYDEDSWAGFTSQKFVYQSQVQEYEAFQLGIVQQAATAFLDHDRAQETALIQLSNRELTRKNVETSRARIAAGWSSEREVLRWESQLAQNDAQVRAARVAILQSQYALNRLRSRPPETLLPTAATTIGEYGFVYARTRITDALVVPDQDRRMRDFLVRLGLRRSPDLAGLDASIAAAERQWTASRRAFYVPSLDFGAGVDDLSNDASGTNVDGREWFIEGVLRFPIFEGGAKVARFEQTRAILASLRTERRATAQAVEETIRSSFAQATGSFDTVGFARRSAEAAQRNYELVNAAYVLGVASILDLLDAQEQQLAAELARVDANYDFLQDLIDAEQALSFYAFLVAPTEVEPLLDALEQQLALP
ncbi:MAG: TolC family protein [Deltaproteobacteria bacterium]|nr:TolC family protein [Deltaproteobacteria bacterium]MBW2447098.1 TolC family protein [Deltaproteobacteria bacterium]